MIHIEQRLTLFRDMIRCCHPLSLWRYTPELELLESNCEEESLLNDLFVSDQIVTRQSCHLQDNPRPCMLSNEMGLMWIAVPEAYELEMQQVHVLGPFFLYDFSVSHVEAELHKRNLNRQLFSYVIRFLRSLPVISLTRALEYAQMLHYCVNGEQITIDDILFLDNLSGCLPNIEPGELHGTYEAEKEMLRYVREGDLSYKEHMKKMASTGRIGNISDGSPLRQLKNMLIVNTTLFSRAAMDGGLPPETAYTLSDQYLQAIEKNNSMQFLIEMNSSMQDDFIQRVHQFRQDTALTKPIRVCIEQMRTRLEEDITLEILAKDLGYAPYYLSKKFKSETGQSFKDYLKQLRLDRAKFLLRNSDASILDISERLQFCSASYFSDSFRKAYGISPTAYREEL